MCGEVHALPTVPAHAKHAGPTHKVPSALAVSRQTLPGLPAVPIIPTVAYPLSK